MWKVEKNSKKLEKALKFVCFDFLKFQLDSWRCKFLKMIKIKWFKISDGDFGKYFHLPVSVNFGKWILFTSKFLVNQKK
jgi:hypothetical protein